MIATKLTLAFETEGKSKQGGHTQREIQFPGDTRVGNPSDPFRIQKSRPQTTHGRLFVAFSNKSIVKLRFFPGSSWAWRCVSHLNCKDRGENADGAPPQTTSYGKETLAHPDRESAGNS